MSGYQTPRVLDSSWAEARRLHPGKMSLSQELYALGHGSMTLPPGESVDMHEWVELFTPAGSAGYYRVSMVTTDMRTGTTDAKLEHGICVLADSVAQKESEDVSGTAATVLGTVLGYQKTQRWALGQCDYAGNVSVNVNYNTVLSLYTNVIEQLNGYHPEYDFSTSPWTISIRENAAAPGIEGRLGRNVASAKVSYDDRDLCNVCYCKQLETTLTDNESIARWGRREGHLDLDEGATPEIAQTAAQMWLDKRKDPAISVTIDAADLSAVTGESIDQIVIGKTYRLAVPKYNAVVDECVISVNWGDLVASPLRAQVSLANHAADLTLHIRKAKGGGGGGGGGGGAKNKLAAAIKRYETQFVKTDQYIALIATERDVETAQLLGKSVFQVAADAISAEVTRATGAESSLQLTLDGITMTSTGVITIKGQTVNLGDYVTMTSFSAMEGLITDLRSGNASFTMLDAGDISCDGIATDSITVNGVNPMNAIAGIGTASESGGQISIPTTRLDYSAGPSINFNIAATNYYQTQVAAAEAAARAEFTLATVTLQGTQASIETIDTSQHAHFTGIGYKTLYQESSPGVYSSVGAHQWFWTTGSHSDGDYYMKTTVQSQYYNAGQTVSDTYYTHTPPSP